MSIKERILDLMYFDNPAHYIILVWVVTWAVVGILAWVGVL